MWATWRQDALLVLKDQLARSSLARYFSVIEENKPAKFLVSKKLPAYFSKNESTKKLWRLHDQITLEFCNLEKEIDARRQSLNAMPDPEKSYMDLKIEIANRILKSCVFCTRRCGANRSIGEIGYCKCKTKIAVSSIFEHTGEEPELVPSGTIFTLGCNMRCLHCQNWTISQWIENGETFTPQQLARSVEDLRSRGCRNANLVGGEPTPWLANWLETFKHVNLNVPVVWNSNSYYSEETARLLIGFVDMYLLDFKYGSNKCSMKISDAPRYLESCTMDHLYGKKYGELIIRVLILPEHLDCCARNIFNWISKNLGHCVRTNILFQYRPEWRAREISEMKRRLTPNEIERAVEMAREAGLVNFIT
jgi:putative pyruvate formate lyase activating enzyme